MVTLSAALVVLATWQIPPGAGVVGTFLSDERSRGGLGSWIEFHPDGTFGQTTGALVEFAWRVDARDLVITLKEPGKPPAEARQPFRVEGDTLTRTGPKSARSARVDIRMTRVGPASAGVPPPVGAWTYPHDTGATAREDYLADGRGVLRVALQQRSGRYRVDGSTLVLQWSEGETSPTSFSLDDGVLTLTGPNRQGRSYRRLGP